MLRCSLNFNPQSVIRYQQFALWVKMSSIMKGDNVKIYMQMMDLENLEKVFFSLKK